ncbi:hypothetical protein [Colwellia sp. MB02u-14]|uniref:hypothetical protein n=1 Tax=Colwellia sp. MB02u-14 TaxID=2759815 RepID=UPI0015F78412|nr:hypothetical protein [Colwellia sp. MB02u-14]MBA6304203.1 hypothetical protein [Colwellia sp. MB02u-14]
MKSQSTTQISVKSAPANKELLALIRNSQLASGAFRSLVHFPDASCCEDENAFVTALVLRHSRHLSLMHTLPDVFERALAFLARCQSSRFAGMYRFWPKADHPSWLGSFCIAEDADDSAIISLELQLYHRQNIEVASNLAQKVLEQHRFFDSNLTRDDWRKQGVFLTWLDYLETPNPVDCCVNTNIIALLAHCGLKDLAGYQQTCQMINDAIVNSDGCETFIASLCPYYPDAVELYFALENAVAMGGDLQPAFHFLSQQAWLLACLRKKQLDNLPICSHQNGTIYWTSEVLQAIRADRLTKITRRQ